MSEQEIEYFNLPQLIKLTFLISLPVDFYYSIYNKTDKSYVLFCPNFSVFSESWIDSLKDE